MAIVHVRGMALKVREYRLSDLAFVKSSYKQAQLFALDAEPKDAAPLFEWLGKRCERLIAKYTVRVLCSVDDEDTNLGWACIDLEKNAAHFVYVKQSYHRIGLASLLLAGLHEPVNVTHWTPICERIAERHQLNYKPSLLLGRKGNQDGTLSNLARGAGEHLPRHVEHLGTAARR